MKASHFLVCGCVAAFAAMSAGAYLLQGETELHPPESLDKRLADLTYEDLVPYFRALITFKDGRPYFCDGRDTLSALPERDPFHEAVARLTLTLLMDDQDGPSLARYYMDPNGPMDPFVQPEVIVGIDKVLNRTKAEILRYAAASQGKAN